MFFAIFTEPVVLVGLVFVSFVYFFLVIFRVSRGWREMYCGHTRLCVCVSVCLRLHAYTIARTRM